MRVWNTPEDGPGPLIAISFPVRSKSKLCVDHVDPATHLLVELLIRVPGT